MSTSKHPEPGHEVVTPDIDDLACDPGIGASKGVTRAGGETRAKEDPSFIAGENTVEGDTANDVDRTGAVNPQQRGRTNA